jgi:MinD-like ATPase involved in chromosome partitioning or flagellar assembly
LDTSPGLNYSSINAIVCADVVLVVTSVDKSDVDGTRRMVHELYDLFGKKARMIINSVPAEHFALKQSESNSVNSEAHQLPVVGVIPCFCDVRNVGGSCLFVAEKPNHPFTKILQEIATTLSVKMGNAVKTKPEPLALKECS